jgi:phosphoribosylaminoimidazolecarboxamide formyltransferase/IMP cyclohydrolase
VKRALLSVSDKTGLTALAAGLVARGYELVSTGGTARALRDAGLDVVDVGEVTGFPEIMDGRVKTLHPAVHGGLLGRAGIDDAVMRTHGITAIDLLVVNLYPFRETISRPDCTVDEAIENIDIGGPAMIRAAAKNHARVTVVVDPDDYTRVLAALDSEGGVPARLRRELAARAYAHTSAYDAAITAYLDRIEGREWPRLLVPSFEHVETLRYGENPHQRAAFYREPGTHAGTLPAATQLQGKPLSFNNIADADAALECVKAFELPACVIVKHANPCGVAVAGTLLDAYELAYRTDPTSAFGGIIAFNRALDATTAETILERQFVEVLVAPSVEEAARSVLTAKKNVRVLATGEWATEPDAALDLKRVAGGLLVQDADRAVLDLEAARIVSKREPTAAEMADLSFVWRVVKHVKSNAIVYGRDRATLGIGAGQMSRVVSARIAALKAADEGLELPGAVMASDAFFPFRDTVDNAAEGGIAAIIQPGGSIRDEEVIAAADEHGIAMVFTGIRHFRH